MEPLFVAAALLSAVLHASWNAAVKASADPARTMSGQMLVAAITVLPVLAWTGLPAPESWKWILLSTLINLGTVKAMLRAYELAGFGLVYPMGRAVSVMLVVPLSAFLAGDRLSAAMLGGIGLIVLSLGLVAWSSRRQGRFDPKALGWTLLAGVGIAFYVMADAQGVRASGSALAYCCAVSWTNALGMSWRQRRDALPWKVLRTTWRVALPAGMASALSYLLILWVWTRAPIAPAVALRDTSAIFAILISVIWLREAFDRWRLMAVVLATAAVPLLRLG